MDKKKILLIDCNLIEDYKFIHFLMKNYEVKAVSSMQTAIKLHHSKYDLIISGVEMPSLDFYSKEETSDDRLTGFVFFKKELKMLNIPVLFWSGNNELKEEFKKLMEENPESRIGFINKQTDEDHLLNMINIFCEKILSYIQPIKTGYKISTDRVCY